MLRFGTLIAAATLAAAPAHAQQLNAREARAFVVGKLFAYQCFEGTRGAGRIMENGSVAGTIQFRGNGSTRYAVLPANTLHVVGDRVCATVRGVPFRPCFNLIKTSANSFRGSVSGLGFAYCDFVRRDRPVIASAEPRGRGTARSEPTDLQPNTAAFPKPIESGDLPPVEQKPAETTTAAVNPAEEKQAEEKPAEASPVEAKAVEAKPDNAKPAEVRPAAAAASDEKPDLRSTKD
jgi:hypothetical protein